MYAGRTHQHMGLALALVAYVGLGVNLAAAKIERFERVPTLEDLGAHLASGLDPKWLVPAYDSGAWKLDGEVLGWETSLELMQQQETSWVKQKLWNNRQGTNFRVEIVPNDEAPYGYVRASIECSFKEDGKDRSQGACSWSIESKSICSCGKVEHKADEIAGEYVPLEMVEIERQDNNPQQRRRGLHREPRITEAVGPKRLR